jgi:hypothetical protein
MEKCKRTPAGHQKLHHPNGWWSFCTPGIRKVKCDSPVKNFAFYGGGKSLVMTMRNRRGVHGAPAIKIIGKSPQLRGNTAQNGLCLFVYNRQRIPNLGLVYRAGLAFKIR